MNAEGSDLTDGIEDLTKRVWSAAWDISCYLLTFLDLYSWSFLEQCISTGYAVYLHLTPFNLVIFFLKYVPAGVGMYKYIKSVNATFRERLKRKQMELEDIQLQIEIINTKMCVREAQFHERSELKRRAAARLRRVRARVRDAMAAGAAPAPGDHAPAGAVGAAHAQATPEEDNEFVLELLKNLKCENAMTERNVDKMDCGERWEGGPAVDQNSPNSSLTDIDMRQDCSVKIVKVTNVYKVAYLKHYIKQKRLRRATQREALRKKMENIKKLLEDWQKTLSMIINSKLTIMDTCSIDMASQEAMGDYSKPREPSESDGDLRNDMFYDEYSLRWIQNPYRPYSCNCEESEEAGACREYGDTRPPPPQRPHEMKAIPEETYSQIAIEEVAAGANDCRDLVAI